MDTVSDKGFNMLDLFICDEIMLNRCKRISSVREAALGTDHYLVKAEFADIAYSDLVLQAS